MINGRQVVSDISDALRELLDKQAITEVLYQYARSMDRLDRELGYSVFWPEATADYHEQMFQGTGHGFIDMVMEGHLLYEAHSHQFTNILIRLNGDSAESETYGDVTLRRRDPDGTLVDSRNLGRYVDRWERRDGEWRILHRQYLHDFDQSGPSSGDFVTTGRRDRIDASYFGA
jgi:hypothetical protein